MARAVKYGEGREVLIESAVRVVAEKGLRGLTFRAVAERAQVNNSLVAHHFGNREALLSAALEWAVERSIALTRLPDFESEEGFADALLTSIRSSPELQAFQYEMILEARRNPVFRAPVEHLYRRYAEAMQQGLLHLGYDENSEGPSRHAFAALDGLVLQYMAGVEESSIRAGLADLWHGLVARAPRTAAN
ncbi:MAG TPA: TetR family transcriptional regulator [Humibacter sp.]|nr:TetR family transcriptional regulator [Marmoricola sp.]HWU46800.1 TetR family transcriptional regulator [Humibacter sp.]